MGGSMVQIIEGQDRHLHTDLFDSLFKTRFETFVLGRQWSLPSRHGREVDQYDDHRAVYFIDLDQDGFIQGSVRLTPTLTSSLTADYYPHLNKTALLLRDPFVL